MKTRNNKSKTVTVASVIATLPGIILLMLGIIYDKQFYYALAIPLIILSIVSFVYYIRKSKEDLFYYLVFGGVAIILVATLLFYATTIGL